ncbi:tetratricopeptide repeat protein [Bauldia litoralis]|uniref:Sel1 repeat-containing protein n=1 Tax=Bauldia litoralis TaxID=665467 RepID=A0A1G6AT79_9HYPH|nr:SEL1-like repeat protein [Bauldia litoralis]SDB11588.1 hypothetical protein SAMN02982931_00839 [Bauldia litoralis]
MDADPDNDDAREAINRSHAMLAKDPGAAIADLEAWADRGSVLAMAHLAGVYYAGKHVQRDFRQANSWYRRAELSGWPEASFMTGLTAMQLGEEEAAFAAYSRGARLDHLPSIYRLAIMYGDGTGTEEDPVAYRSLLERGAAMGHMYSRRDLGLAYLKEGSGLSLMRGLAMIAGVYLSALGIAARGIATGREIDDRLR